jgi:hypothetical protein
MWLRQLIDIGFIYCYVVMAAGVGFQIWKALAPKRGDFHGANRKWFYPVIEIIGIFNPRSLLVAAVQIAATARALLVLPFTRLRSVKLKLPNDLLTVVNGGNRWGENHSLIEVSQIWAVDLVFLKNGCTFNSKSDNCTLESFYSYEVPVKSPISGVVTKTRDGLKDRRFLFGCVWPFVRSIWGNYVEVRSPDGFRILFAHLQRGSILVKEGDVVEEGSFLGKIGNSGLSSEPHLHMQCFSHGGRYFGLGNKIEFL